MIIENITNPGHPPEGGDTVKITYDNGNIEETIYTGDEFNSVPNYPSIVVFNIDLYVDGLPSLPVGDIYWLEQNTPFTLQAEILEPEGFEGLAASFIIIAERMVDATIPVDDQRFIANIANQGLTITSTEGFESSGNYLINPSRLNRGLERIDAPFRVEFTPIEFDVIRT